MSNHHMSSQHSSSSQVCTAKNLAKGLALNVAFIYLFSTYMSEGKV